MIPAFFWGAEKGMEDGQEVFLKFGEGFVFWVFFLQTEEEEEERRKNDNLTSFPQQTIGNILLKGTLAP